jgi:hypothetical protein
MSNPRPMPTVRQAPEGKGRNPRPMPTVQPAPPGKNPMGNRQPGPSLMLPNPTTPPAETPTRGPLNLRELTIQPAPPEKQRDFDELRRRRGSRGVLFDAIMRRMQA